MTGNLIDTIFNETLNYLEQMPKAKRKVIGQFFTSVETARYMASMFTNPQKADISILDPGTGSGILTAAAVERLQKESIVEHINITCYETSEDVLPLLKKNLAYIKNNSSIPVEYNIIEENYIISQSDDFKNNLNDGVPKYDWIISNPPYKKIKKDAEEAVSMPAVCYGAPNLYFLFTAMGLFNLDEHGELVYIIPRSWTSGAYFQKFREYLFEHGTLRQMHLFVSRDKVFEKESVLQETMIIKVDKSAVKGDIKITTTKTNGDFDDISEIEIPYTSVVAGPENYVYLVTTEAERAVLNSLHRWNNTLLSLGFKMRTGLTVDFRSTEYLHNNNEPNTVPMLYAHHIKNGRVQFSSNRENEYVSTVKAGLLQKNTNYLLVKRFTTKEENRRFQCGVFLGSDMPEYEVISTHNKVNFIEKMDSEMSIQQLYGLYVIFNSTLYDQYYRILNGSTQVNSTEVNTMPMPPIDIIEKLGFTLMKRDDLSVATCDNILEGVLNE